MPLMPSPIAALTPAAGVERHYGKYRGTVTSNSDPNGVGRIKANVPEVLLGVESGWALPCAPWAGDDQGAFAVPPQGANVWIEFEAGDPSRPLWSGCWWSAGKVPKTEAGAVATPSVKVIRSEKGLLVSLDDDGQTISVSDQNGSNMLRIEVQPGLIKVKGATKAVVEAPQIELVENATHPVVFGDQLIQYLNQVVQMYQTHMHPGELALGAFPVTPAPPVPPLPPPTPSLNSTKVKVG